MTESSPESCRRQVECLVPPPAENIADAVYPPASDAWVDSDIRRILASPSPYFCTLDRFSADTSDRCGSHYVGLDMNTSCKALDRRLEEDGQSFSVSSPDGPLQRGGPCQWKENNCANAPCFDHESQSGSIQQVGKVVIVKWGEQVRKIGVDGSANAIKDAIKSVFGLRTKKTFWIEDEYGMARGFDCLIPQMTYTLHTV